MDPRSDTDTHTLTRTRGRERERERSRSFRGLNIPRRWHWGALTKTTEDDGPTDRPAPLKQQQRPLSAPAAPCKRLKTYLLWGVVPRDGWRRRSRALLSNSSHGRCASATAACWPTQATPRHWRPRRRCCGAFGCAVMVAAAAAGARAGRLSLSLAPSYVLVCVCLCQSEGPSALQPHRQ